MWPACSLLYRYYFGRHSSELPQLVPLPFSQGKSTRYSDRLHDFFATIPRCYKDVYVNSFFPRSARIRISLPIECFPLTYDLSGCKSKINRHLFNCRFFLNRFPVCFNLFVLFFLVTLYLIISVQPSWSESQFLKKSIRKKVNGLEWILGCSN